MKLEFKFEFVINCLDKYVYVYKLDQKNSEKKYDIREKGIQISLKLFNFIKNNNLDVFFYKEDNFKFDNLKIYFYVCCNNLDYIKLNQNIFNEKYIQELKLPQLQKLTSIFLKNRYLKIIFTYIENIFLSNNYEKIGNYFIKTKLSSYHFPNLKKEKNYINNNIYDFYNSIDYSFYIGYLIDDNEIFLNYLEIENNNFYLEIEIKIKCGIIYFKQANCYKYLDELYENQNRIDLLNKQFLSKINIITVSKKMKKIKDLKTNFFSFITEDINLLLNRPFILNSKTRFFCPVLINDILKIFKNHIENKTKKNIFYNIEFTNIYITSNELDFIDMKIKILPEENLNFISEKMIKYYEDDNYKNFPFSQLYSNYFLNKNNNENYDIDLNDITNIFVYFNLVLAPDNLIFYVDKNNNIFIVSPENIIYFETKLFEYYTYLNIIKKEKKEKEINELIEESTNETSFELSNSDNNSKKKFSLINSSLDYNLIRPNFKKSSLKPFKKENIKLQNKCEVDWGNNLVSKKERKLFHIKRKEIMKRENKLIDEKYENNLINKSFIENTNKLHFKLGFMTPSLKNLKLTLNNN